MTSERAGMHRHERAAHAGWSAVSEPERGWCEPTVEQELPGLGLVCLGAQVKLDGSLIGDTPAPIWARLRELSNRWRGARAVNVRQEPIPAAYRVFYRHIGLDPDVNPTPLEQAVRERMVDGGFLSKGALMDIATIVLLDTGVPVWALDALALDGPLGIRLGRDGESLGDGSQSAPVAGGRLVVADRRRAVAVLFGETAACCRPDARSESVALFAVRVAGVPLLHVEEALWEYRALLEGG